jgi:hypothetical protein
VPVKTCNLGILDDKCVWGTLHVQISFIM